MNENVENRSEQLRQDITSEMERHRRRQDMVIETLLENKRREQAREVANLREQQYARERALVQIHESQIEMLSQRHAYEFREYSCELLDQQRSEAQNLVRLLEGNRLLSLQQRPMDVDENNNNIRERADAVGDAAVRAPAQAPEFRPIAERAHRAPGAFDVYHLNEADASLLVPGDDHAVDRLVADRTELPRVRAVADYLENEEEFEMDDWMEDEENEQAFNLDVPREPRVEADARERFRARLADARHEGFLHAIFDAERLRQGTKTDHCFSRECSICDVSPLQRAVFTCGHVVCLACAEQIKLAAEEDQILLNCPTCRQPGAFAKLWEKRIEEDEVE